MPKVKPTLTIQADEKSTAESVCVTRYHWLLRWALHFCGGDREEAEDLVQDTFVQMLSSWSTIRDTSNPERYLYTYLRYGFLRRRNLGRRYSFQTLSSIDFESLEMSAAQGKTHLLEWQEEIGCVVDYLCWRKKATRAASFLLLRFFHGFYPSEIMRIARLSRKAVDDGLANAREEAKAHAEDPRKLQVIHRGALLAAPELHSALPAEDFIKQMLQRIFAARDGDCLSFKALVGRYAGPSETGIDCSLLAHIVSCEACLDVVRRTINLPPRGSRALEDVLSYEPRGDAKQPLDPMRVNRTAQSSFQRARERYRDVMEHRPRTLTILVNGNPIATRDLVRGLNEITIETRAADAPQLIEIISEQASLFSVPVVDLPPDADPEQYFETLLSDARRLGVRLDFQADGIRVHVTYHDTESLARAAVSPLEMETASDASGASRMVGVDRRHGMRERLRRWLGLNSTAGWQLPAAAAALLIPCLAFMVWLQVRRPGLEPEGVLTRAVNTAANTTGSGVVVQRLRITAAHQTLVETLHRDQAGRRVPRQEKLDPAQRRIEDEMTVADIPWSDPLSPASFKDWHDRQPHASDAPVRQDGNLLTLVTVTPDGAVRRASLVLRADTLHAVARTAEFRDNERVEIAELDYSVLPWEQRDPSWFEPLAEPGNVFAPAHPVAPDAGSHALLPTDAQLDEAELAVRLALAESHADEQERLTVTRGARAVAVNGLVATEERKRELETRLRAIPHAKDAIRTFAEFRSSPDAQPETRVAMASSSASASPLDAMLAESNRASEDAAAVHSLLLDAAFSLRQSALAYADLQTRFAPERLSTEASERQDLLANLYCERIRAAKAKEQRALRLLDVKAVLPAAAASGDLSTVALRNSQLCFELISQDAQPHQSARAILEELSASLANLDTALNNAASPAQQSLSSSPAVRQDRK
jgi:DNA-directed RNA polymerase specialized sigma24 family protein